MRLLSKLLMIGGGIIGSGLLTGCEPADNKSGNINKESNVETPFYIKAGISSADYNQKNQQHPKKKIDKQPAGLNFYEQHWSTKQPGAVQVEHGDYSFTIPHALSTMGTEDTDYPDRGIYDFSINSGITQAEFIDHDEARVKFMLMLQSLVGLGWKSYIEFHSDPRLSGRESFQYAQKDSIYTPDPLYMPSYDEWMSLDSSHAWALYANDVFLEVSFRRNRKFMKDNKPGVYLLTFTLLTHDAKARSYFQGDEREQWQTLWVESIKKDKLSRYKKEVALIEQGYHINTDYIEPEFHPNDPVEPEGEEVEALLAIINNQPR